MESRDNLRFCGTFKSISVSFAKLVNDDEDQTVKGLETKRRVNNETMSTPQPKHIF